MIMKNPILEKVTRKIYYQSLIVTKYTNEKNKRIIYYKFLWKSINIGVINKAIYKKQSQKAAACWRADEWLYSFENKKEIIKI